MVGAEAKLSRDEVLHPGSPRGRPGRKGFWECPRVNLLVQSRRKEVQARCAQPLQSLNWHCISLPWRVLDRGWTVPRQRCAALD